MDLINTKQKNKTVLDATHPFSFIRYQKLSVFLLKNFDKIYGRPSGILLS